MTLLNFFVIDQGESNPVEYDSETIVKDFIIDYLKKKNIYATLNREVYTFKINGRVLNSDKFANKKIYELIRPGGKVILDRKKVITYGFQ
jgi:hypothetical protein